MNVLLDTHSFLWFNDSSGRLSATAKVIIENRSNLVFVIPASYWELAIKISHGKFKLTGGSFETLWRSGIDNNGFKILPIELTHCSQLISLPFHHKDPFDRMLVAQAIAEDLPLISVDTRLHAYGVRRVW